jgi:pSer/pThr/pTyr-binding forkhead associated (FHA) protein
MDNTTKKILNFYPNNAFLIINGRIFPLDKNEVTIGRSLDNQLVINDLGVSRTHAKLQARGGRFMIRDQNSTSGTYVNGQRVRRKTLDSGDIISLAGIPMLYVEDSPGLSGTSWESTRPFEEA